MRTLIHFFCGLAMALAFPGCNSGKYAFTDLPERRIEFGDGGGFTGAVRTFTLLENGQLFEHRSLDNSTVERKKVRRKTAADLFRSLEAVDWQALPEDAPGNRYFFLRLKGDPAHQCVWGAEGSNPPAGLEAPYQALQALVR